MLALAPPGSQPHLATMVFRAPARSTSAGADAASNMRRQALSIAPRSTPDQCVARRVPLAGEARALQAYAPARKQGLHAVACTPSVLCAMATCGSASRNLAHPLSAAGSGELQVKFVLWRRAQLVHRVASNLQRGAGILVDDKGIQHIFLRLRKQRKVVGATAVQPDAAKEADPSSSFIPAYILRPTSSSGR